MDTDQKTTAEKNARRFIPKSVKIDSWEGVKSFYDDLKDRKFNSLKDFENWLLDRSELDAVLAEESRWRYIFTSVDTTDSAAKESLEFFYNHISPKMIEIGDVLNKKFIDSPYLNELDQEKYFIYIRQVKNSIELFTEKNIPLQQKLSIKQNEFGTISSKMSVTIENAELTLQQARVLLKRQDRKLREEVYKKIASRRFQDKDALDHLMNELIGLRNEVAENAGFDNYRDYKFKELGRFDYSPKDCFEFHDSILYEVMPVISGFVKERKEKLGYDVLKPWDLEVDITGKPSLKPFNNADELIDRSIQCFDVIDPYFGECLKTMKKMERLDLESRIGKAPGGYNMPLPQTNVPFIFMNSAGTQRDLTTMMHEGGHAVHAFLTENIELTELKNTPSEIAEVASMAMELISMDQWHLFYEDKDELNRAKKEQLKGLFSVFPSVSMVDGLQHWLYTNPNHTAEERASKWKELSDKYSSNLVDHSGFEKERAYGWQRILHIFEVPFYFVEYAIAQLGAIAIWKQYKENPKKALDNYKAALKLGYTKTLPEIYEAAGIKFNFSRDYVRELVEFVKGELDKLD